ncbi:Hypothetical protein Tpal_1295 [Trichococcus palustris]|jgi:hypothetical protein|uniref:Uncharacterized protein n=2 Tax=Trichococcus palustris TaxID=140314 RepID=A0A143YIP5_9LACT|nr:Hypothetical protein Tpal_1295 [Trichococcus palustris]SFL19873.1 hypothetical protein SAMN04488076_1358 [Trichococcus palustris]
MGCKKMGFDWPNMSSSYANFAGILAGFVFSGIFLLLEDEKRDASEVISILMVGFFGLLLSAFLFSNISGLSMGTANPLQLRMLSFRILVASIIFSITIMQMFLSLVFIFILYRLPQQVLSLSKMIYYGSAFIATMFVIRTFSALYTDVNILSTLTRDLFLTVLVSAVVLFILSKIFRRKLDIMFEKYFVRIITSSFVFMLALVIAYNTDMYLMEMPVIADHFIMVVFTINMMNNNFSINHEYRTMKIKENR